VRLRGKEMRKRLLLSSFFITLFMRIICSNTASAYDYYPYYDPFAIWGTCLLIYLILFFVWLILAIFVYKDAEKRDKSGVLWLIIVLLTGIIGLIIWLVVRPPLGGEIPMPTYQSPPQYRVCPRCNSNIPMFSRFCQHCGQQFETPSSFEKENKPKYCRNCGSVIQSNRKFCSECGYKF
jgi:RNA polymerase subunit RPABC4/transcription elongation factor Spt4